MRWRHGSWYDVIATRVALVTSSQGEPHEQQWSRWFSGDDVTVAAGVWARVTMTSSPWPIDDDVTERSDDDCDVIT